MTRNILPIVRAMTRGSIDSWDSPNGINLCVGPAMISAQSITTAIKNARVIMLKRKKFDPSLSLPARCKQAFKSNAG